MIIVRVEINGQDLKMDCKEVRKWKGIQVESKGVSPQRERLEGEDGDTGPVRTGPSQKLSDHIAVPEVKGRTWQSSHRARTMYLQYSNDNMELVPVWTLVTAFHGLGQDCEVA